MSHYLSTLALALAAAFFTPQVKAEKVIVYREGQLVNPHDVAAVLGKSRSIRLRSIRLLDDAPAAAPTKYVAAAAAVALAKTATHSSAAQPAVRDDANANASALSLPVRFAFDSTDILPAARAQLDALADGIKLLAPDSLVTVEGHTDAAGTDAYNLQLSHGRARAVRDYLVQHHGIDGARLKTMGYGEGRLVEDADPHAVVNRRVQFRGS